MAAKGRRKPSPSKRKVCSTKAKRKPRPKPYREAEPLDIGEGFRSREPAPRVTRAIDMVGRDGDTLSEDPSPGEDFGSR